MKNLVRTKKGVFAGVCGGIAQYLGIDVTVVRLIWVVGSIIMGAGFLGLVIYIICALIIPLEDDIID